MTYTADQTATIPTPTPTPTAIGTGLLARDEAVAVLRGVLGEAVSNEALGNAVDALREAEAAAWEQLPAEINPDMGYNFEFLSCSETCWLGRQVLLEGATFRVFRQR